MSESLGIIQLGPTADYSTEKLKERLSPKFPHYEVKTVTAMDTPAMAYDSFREQYHSTRILAFLEEYAQTVRMDHILGVASFDLYVPGMNFVFGEARCPGGVAVISTYRLRVKRLDDSDLFASRILKEAVHEIGHMMGLRHCTEPSCVMYFSERLADTDRKGDDFCAECESKMKWLEVE
jgi:archaemetzincin